MQETTLYVWSGLGALVGTLLLLIVLLWASKTTLRQAREVWQVLRGYRGAVEAGIDEPTDLLIRELARISKVPPALWSAFLTGLLRSIADGLDGLLPAPAETGSEPEGNGTL